MRLTTGSMIKMSRFLFFGRNQRSNGFVERRGDNISTPNNYNVVANKENSLFLRNGVNKTLYSKPDSRSFIVALACFQHWS
jgi:hypothetical protein